MPWTIEEALNDEVLKDQRIFHSEYDYCVGSRSTRVTIRLYRIPDSNTFEFEQSHFMHTPTQMGPYRTSHNFADSEANALHLAIRTLTEHYKEAVAAGHAPSDQWLVENAFFAK